jgi:protein-S-isoprenylcysteine O-methyltransferase Ste14
MGRCGIGPKFGTITLGYALAAGYMTHRRPDLFEISVVPGAWLLAAGALPVCWGIWLYAHALRVLGQAIREDRLAVTGPFASVRHPIYALWILLLIPGVGLMLRSWLVLTATILGCISFRILIPREEAEVEAKYGDEYRAYCRARSRLLPTPWRRHGIPPREGRQHDSVVTDD